MILQEPEKFKEVWQAVVDGVTANGRSPVIKEICQITGISSTAAVSYQLGWLAMSGYLEVVPSHDGEQVSGYTVPGTLHIINGKQAFHNLFALLCDSPYLDRDDINRMVDADGSINYAQVLNFAWVAIREGTEGYAG